MHRQLWKKLSKKQKGDGVVPEEATLHLNLYLYVHLFHHLSVIVHLLHAECFWKQQENPRRRPSFQWTDPSLCLLWGTKQTWSGHCSPGGWAVTDPSQPFRGGQWLGDGKHLAVQPGAGRGTLSPVGCCIWAILCSSPGP